MYGDLVKLVELQPMPDSIRASANFAPEVL